MVNKSLRDRLTPCVPLRFPGFEKQYQYEKRTGIGETLAYNFEPVDCRDWYRNFADRVIGAVDEGRYLPLYRMGDGEYIFALQRNPEGEKAFWDLSLRGMARRLLRNIRGEAQRGSGGAYTPQERRNTYDEFVNGLRLVSRNGILSMGLHDTDLYSDYIPDIFDWFDKKGIQLSRKNYIHVYAVYALLNGPDSRRLLNDRQVLVVTNLYPQRKRNIKRGLRKKGVERVEFLSVSENKSMTDRINTEDISSQIDLALICAGIGSINVINSLTSIKVPQIDVGFSLNVIADPSRRWWRPFCTPDSKFDPNKVEWI
jgi:hypothetical protein